MPRGQEGSMRTHEDLQSKSQESRIVIIILIPGDMCNLQGSPSHGLGVPHMWVEIAHIWCMQKNTDILSSQDTEATGVSVGT